MDFDMNSSVPANSNAVQTTGFDMSSSQPINSSPPKKQPSAIDSFLRGIMKYSPGEYLETQQARFDLYAGVNPEDSKEVKDKKYQDAIAREGQEVNQEAMNAFNPKTGKWETPKESPQYAQEQKNINDFEKKRDKEIASQGILRQFRDPMTAAIGMGAISNPITTALGVGVYTLKDHFFDGRRWIESEHPNASPLVKDGVEMLDFLATVSVLGGGAALAKKFYMDKASDLNLPKSMTIDKSQVEKAKGTNTLEKLGITNDHVKASLNSDLSIQVPTEKIVDLATTGNWDKVKEDLGITPSKPELPIQLGLGEGQGEVQTNKYVDEPKLNFSLKGNMKNTANEARKQVTGKIDKQIIKINQWAESEKKSIPDENEQKGMFWYAGAGGDKSKIVDFMHRMESKQLPKVKVSEGEIINEEGVNVGKVNYQNMGEESFNIDVNDPRKNYGTSTVAEVLAQNGTIYGDVGANNTGAQEFWKNIGGKLNKTESGNYRLTLTKEDFDEAIKKSNKVRANDVSNKEKSIKEYYKEIKPQLQAALDLSPKAIEAVKQGSQYYAEAGTVAKNLGTIENIRENYQSNRIYKPEKVEDFIATGKRRSTLTTSHAKQRFYETPFDAVLGGKQFATTNYFDALTIHNEELAYVNTTRAMLDQMEKMDLGEWSERRGMPSGYKQVGDLRKGTQMFIAPEGIAKGLEAITDPNIVRKVEELNAFGKLNGFVKSFNVAFSFFHHFQFVKQVISSKGGEGILGEFAAKMSKGEDPFESEAFKEMERNLSEDGLRTSMRQANFDIMADLRNVKGKWIDKIEALPGVKQTIKLADASNKLLFDKMQRYFKVMTAGQRVADWVAKNPNASEEKAIESRRGICRAINNTFGGLNWEMLGVNKNQQALLRLGLFAPDWLLSSILNTKDAFFDWNTEAGRVSRSTVIKGLIIGTTMTQLMNKITTGHFTDENKKGHQFEWEESPNVYTNFYGGATGELVKFSSNVVETGGLKGALRYISNKTSPGIRTALMMGTQKNYAGEDIFKGSNDFDKNINGLLNIASTLAPVPFAEQSSSIGYLTDKNNPLSGKIGVATGLERYSVGENKWDKDSGKIMNQFYKTVGPNKFDEANSEYMNRLDKWEHKVQTDEEYRKLSDDEKKSLYTSEKEKIKREIMKEYGFNYHKSPSLSKKERYSILND